jgi:hypothetical protein
MLQAGKTPAFAMTLGNRYSNMIELMFWFVKEENIEREIDSEHSLTKTKAEI